MVRGGVRRSGTRQLVARPGVAGRGGHGRSQRGAAAAWRGAAGQGAGDGAPKPHRRRAPAAMTSPVGRPAWTGRYSMLLQRLSAPLVCKIYSSACRFYSKFSKFTVKCKTVNFTARTLGGGGGDEPRSASLYCISRRGEANSCYWRSLWNTLFLRAPNVFRIEPNFIPREMAASQ